MGKEKEIVRGPEQLVAWQLCMELGTHLANAVSTGVVARDVEFCRQIRASSSAPAAHIAEGFGRWGPKEFAHYLRMAVGSLMETRTHLRYGLDRKYFTPKVHSDAATLCGRALRMTQRLLASKVRQLEAEKRKKIHPPP